MKNMVERFIDSKIDNYEEKKKEAIRRMQALNLFDGVIKQFIEDGYVNESVPPFGACYWLNDEQKKRVKKFEEKYNALVYHVIHAFYEEIGEVEHYLYVGKNTEEWDMDMENIKDGELFVYVNTITYPDFSEFGYIGYKLTCAAGLARTW